MTALDRQVAERRGWTWDSANEWWIDTDGAVLLGSAAYLPSMNLLQAVQLWEEARPEGWRLRVEQLGHDKWGVSVLSASASRRYPLLNFTDLPRAITQAWVEAKGGPLT